MDINLFQSLIYQEIVYRISLCTIQLFSKIGWGITMDHLKTKGISNTATVRISQVVASIGCTLVLIGTNHWELDRWYENDTDSLFFHFALLSLLGICASISSSGYLTSVASIAPSYTGVIASIVYICENIGGYLPPFIILHLYNMVSFE